MSNCLYCGRAIGDAMRIDALYCKNSHRVMACNVRKEVTRLFGRGKFYYENNELLTLQRVKFLLEKGGIVKEAERVVKAKKIVFIRFDDSPQRLPVKFCKSDFKQKVLVK